MTNEEFFSRIDAINRALTDPLPDEDHVAIQAKSRVDHFQIAERVRVALLSLSGFPYPTNAMEWVMLGHSDKEWLRWLEVWGEIR